MADKLLSLKEGGSLNKREITNVLLSTEGVSEVAWQDQSGRLYLKVDKKKITEDALRKLIGEGNLSLDPTEGGKSVVPGE